MTEYLKREDVRRTVLHNEGDAVIAAIDELPVIDIVHCGDCVHRDPEDKKCDHGWMYFSFKRPDNGFCEHGKRKDGTA